MSRIAFSALFFVAVVCVSVAASTRVRIDTNMGAIEAELFEDKAPITVKNFVGYVQNGHYNNLIFHRVIPNFMIQGGGYTEKFVERPTKAPIKNEADNGLLNKRGTLAMARTSAINSATSQFFINHADNSFLDHGSRDFGYCVFGRVTKGMDVVDRIAALSTGSRGPFPTDVPLQSVVINKVTLM